MDQSFMRILMIGNLDACLLNDRKLESLHKVHTHTHKIVSITEKLRKLMKLRLLS